MVRPPPTPITAKPGMSWRKEVWRPSKLIDRMPAAIRAMAIPIER